MMSLVDFRCSLGKLAVGKSDIELTRQREIMYGFAYSIYESWTNGK
ncbi:MAG: hypothetical protein ACI83D_000356 [Planctomycetota bacterium]|jgi:hypothetical protein